MGINDIKILKKADLFFGVFAALTVITGLLRIYYFGKGADYYLSNPIFIAKISLFILVGVISIYPSSQFLKLKNSNKEAQKIKCFKTILFLIKIEFILLLSIPLLAVLVAKGIGL